jgi:hypothetical protein
MTAVLAGVFAASLLALTGCGANQAGAAAVLGDQRISESQLNDQVQALLSAQGLTAEDASSELVTNTLDRMITSNLVEQLADREGIVVGQGEIDVIRLQYVAQAGGQAELDALLLQQGVLAADVDKVIKLNLQVSKIGEKLAPGVEPEVQGGAVFIAASELSVELGTEVAPRFGTWDPENLTIGPVANNVSAPIGVDLGQG